MRQVNKTLLIVCEGKLTEPNYFKGLVDTEVDKNAPYKVKISPKPPENQIQDANLEQPIEIQSSRKKRQIKNIGKDLEGELIPLEYAAQPVRYVWEAREGLLSGVYDEAWAVFDFDGHPAHEKALELADQEIDGKMVQIAFSSISFETWILLHFEMNETAYSKSQCRTGKILHDCGQAIHASDCNGTLCPTGRMKIMDFISRDSDVKDIKYGPLREFTQAAILRAIQIRNKCISDLPEVPFYSYNPYTSVDKLVFKLLNFEKDYKWVLFSQIVIQKLPVTIKVFESYFELIITNDSEITFILNETDLNLVNVNGDLISIVSRTVLSPHEWTTIKVDLKLFHEFNPRYISFISGGENNIAELPHQFVPILVE